MKQISTIALILIVFLQTFSRFVVEGDYYLNRSYISKVLCINKAKPAMHCNGKCYLARKLKEQQKQEQRAPNQKKEVVEFQPFFLPNVFYATNIYMSTKLIYHHSDDMIGSTFPHTVFHPPAI